MEYIYTLNQSDLIKLGIEHTGAKEYSIKQSGWNGEFYRMFEWFEHTYTNSKGRTYQGIERGNVIIEGDELSIEQQTYIIKNCKCDEYE